MAAPEGGKLAMELANSIGRLAGLLSDARETGSLAYTEESVALAKAQIDAIEVSHRMQRNDFFSWHSRAFASVPIAGQIHPQGIRPNRGHYLLTLRNYRLCTLGYTSS
ncbi:hypothetical protein SMMN14_02531 [Sphaerulina musiva]